MSFGLFLSWLVTSLSLETGYLTLYFLGLVMRAISIETEWKAFLAVDMASKVLAPCVTTALLESAAADATSQGAAARGHVRCAVIAPCVCFRDAAQSSDRDAAGSNNACISMC